MVGMGAMEKICIGEQGLFKKLKQAGHEENVQKSQGSQEIVKKK